MSEPDNTPAADGDERALPNGNGDPGPGPGRGPTSVAVAFSTPATTLMVVGVPFTVQGSAGSEPPGEMADVTLTMDGTSVPVINDGNWARWHAVVTVTGSGSHTFTATATAGTLQKTATLRLTASPVLTPASPTPAMGIITTSTLTLTADIAIGSPAFPITASGWQYQLAGGAWQRPTAVTQPAASTWQLTLALPATPVQPGGSSYPLVIMGTAANLTATLALTVHAVDQTAPAITSVNAPAEVAAGTTPTVTVQATDRPSPNTVFSGVPATGVTVLLDSQPCAITQTIPGDPGTWSAILPAITHDLHTLAVTVTDAAGNSASQAQPISVALTSWTRLEPVPRDPTLMEGLQAQVADPFWLLARQAAFGELTGQDSASPVSFRLRATASRLTRFRPAREPGTANPATGPGELITADGGPLEMLAEAEAEPAPGSIRPVFAAQAGLHYLRLLRRAASTGDLTTYEQGLLASYPFPPAAPAAPSPQAGVPPPPSAGDTTLMPYAARVPDGSRLYSDLAAALRPAGGGQGQLPASPPLGGAIAPVITSAAETWLSWYDAVSGQELGQRDTWIPERAEYAFSIAAPGPGAETVLAAAELDTGELDWHDFDLLASSEVTAASPTVGLGAEPGDLATGDTSIVITGLPAPVTFRGMPNRCWWDFEDSSIDFGAITAPVESVTTSVIVEFAMCYGNDHFIVPVPLAIGSVLRVSSLVVTDTFGELLQVRSVADVDSATGPFRLFEHSIPDKTGTTAGRDPLFIMFPTAGEEIYGPALEEVHFVRDEAAEAVWAIEQTALGPIGMPVDRTADALAHFTPLTPTPSDGVSPPTRTYVLRSDVEADWFPFLMTYTPTSGEAATATATQLAMADVPPLAVILPNHPLTNPPPTPLPWGRILAPFAPVTPATGAAKQPGVLMPLEEITRTGTQIVRAWRYARWIDGKQLSWVGRRVRPGRGPGASGLSFDLAI